MYASGLICRLVCRDCKEKPCSRQNWMEKNECPKIIEANERLGRCCATCLHCVDWKYCSQKRIDPNENVTFNLDKYLIRGASHSYG